MGLAASQARLLTITARVHDVEFEAQQIMSKKIALATDKDKLYSDYCAALDAKKIQVAFNGDSGALNYVDATFATVCGYQPKRAGTYALTDAETGALIVDDDVYEAYKVFEGRDKYAFAQEMLGFDYEDGCSHRDEGDESHSSTEIGISTRGDYDSNNSPEFSGTFTDAKTGETIGWTLMTDAEIAVYKAHESDLSDAYSQFKESLASNDKNEVKSAIEKFRNNLYKDNSRAQEIFDGMVSNVGYEDFGDFSKGEFDYYVQLFEGIEAAGGCIPISEYSMNGSTDNDWFNMIVQSGTAIINQYESSGASKGWKAVSTTTGSTFKEVSDEVGIKKAEANYQYELNKINQKDKRFDQDLKKLETERTALTTELDSIKKVKDENIERTFGIFS